MINTNLPKDFKCISIKLASPNAIRNWAERLLPDGTVVGEVTKSETINYRTFKPEPDGLFCEKIFGPVKSWECYCGKTKHTRPYQDDDEDQLPPEEAPMYCPYCHVEITESTVRRYRMGYIKLAAPAVHIWYLKSIPSYLAILLESRPKDLESIIYFTNFSGEKEEESMTASPKGKWNPYCWFAFLKYTVESENTWYVFIRDELISWTSKYRCFEDTTETFGAHVISQKLEELDIDEIQASNIREIKSLSNLKKIKVKVYHNTSDDYLTEYSEEQEVVDKDLSFFKESKKINHVTLKIGDVIDIEDGLSGQCYSSYDGSGDFIDYINYKIETC